MYEVNNIVVGCVTGIEKYGIFVGLENSYSGLIHISEVSDGFVKSINDYVDIGETIKVKILSVDEKNRHLKLSIKNIEYRRKKIVKSKIKETLNGFSSLEKMLPYWIESKKDELINETVK